MLIVQPRALMRAALMLRPLPSFSHSPALKSLPQGPPEPERENLVEYYSIQGDLWFPSRLNINVGTESPTEASCCLRKHATPSPSTFSLKVRQVHSKLPTGGRDLIPRPDQFHLQFRLPRQARSFVGDPSRLKQFFRRRNGIRRSAWYHFPRAR